jgi:Transposase DDE domain/Transposase domain (DUF772)
MSLIWSPPVETSDAEERILSRCKKAKLFVFLRRHRHELLDDAFQSELVAMYPERKSGKEPVAPALLAVVTIMQAWLGVSDEDAVEFAEMDKRWQMVLGVLGSDEAPFSQGALFNFRQRLIAHDLDRQFIDRTVALARASRGFSHTALRAAFDASPLFGAGRVEDTFNLIGHAVREVLSTVAGRLGVDIEQAAERAGIPLVVGSSLKAALDIDWDDPKQKGQALAQLLGQVQSLEAFLRREMSEALSAPPLKEQWETVQQILSQDLEPDPAGGGMRIRRGVSKERRISIRDGEMRHGRKSKSSRFDGFKRHLGLDLDAGLIVAAAITPGNRPEGEAASDLFSDVEKQGFSVEDCHIDRGYLAAQALEERRRLGMRVHCKAFPLRNFGRFTKADFKLDFQSQRITCPAGASVSLLPGAVARFPTTTCQPCPLRLQCTAASHRSVSIHPHEPFLVELRARQHTPEGRAQLRRRIPVEHGLAHLGASQGKRARYLGVRKNLFDLRRHAAVFNLFAAAA